MAPREVLVSTPGSRVIFTCVVNPSDEVIGIEWLLNGTLLDNSNLVNATVFLIARGLGQLEFASVSSELNMTRIECRALYSGGIIEDSDHSSLLLLQGLMIYLQTLC